MSETADPFNEDVEPEGDAPFDASHRGSIRKKKRADRLLLQQRAEVAKVVMDHPHGRAWMAWLLHDVCGLYAPTDNEAHHTPSLHFREGARAVALILHEELLSACPTSYVMLMQENLKPKAPK